MPFNEDRAREIHGSIYDYSKVDYIDMRTRVEIGCPHHGPFWQTPKNHIYDGRGCKQCANDRIRGSFDAVRANIKHNSKYDYSKVRYTNTDTKVQIGCPNHGIFWQTPHKHIVQGTGCPKCKGDRLADDRRMTKEKFLIRATSIHGNRYDYSNVQIVHGHAKVEIKCSAHGSFWQTPTNHLDNHNGCPQCGYNISTTGRVWLDRVAPAHVLREHVLAINDKRFKVDGYDPVTNTIYEYFGVFWHGCPEYTDHTKCNPRNGKPFAELYDATLQRIATFRSAGFNLVYEWGR